MSLVEQDRVWLAACQGLAGVREVGREPGLCASVIAQDGVYVINNAAVDPRTLEHPLVRGELGLRFYAAAPIRTHDGYRLGTVNVIDNRPREATPRQLKALEHLAAMVLRRAGAAPDGDPQRGRRAAPARVGQLGRSGYNLEHAFQQFNLVRRFVVMAVAVPLAAAGARKLSDVVDLAARAEPRHPPAAAGRRCAAGLLSGAEEAPPLGEVGIVGPPG